MKNHEEKVERPEDTSVNSDTCITGAPRGHRKRDTEAVFEGMSLRIPQDEMFLSRSKMLTKGEQYRYKFPTCTERSHGHWNGGKEL